MNSSVLERALQQHRTSKYFIFRSLITGRWQVIHRGRFIHPHGDPTDIAARRRAHYHWKGIIR